MTTKRSTMTAGALALGALAAAILSTTDTDTDGPTLSVSLTNFNEVAQVNPAHRTTNGIVFVLGDEIHITTNAADWAQEVFCTNALVLRWPGVTDKCYDVQWTSDFVTWTHSHAWRVGTDTEIVFLAPTDLPQAVFRLRVLDCATVTNALPIPPPPEPPRIPTSGFARL